MSEDIATSLRMNKELSRELDKIADETARSKNSVMVTFLKWTVEVWKRNKENKPKHQA